MTVDELIIQIQQGREDLIPELWDQVKGLIRYFAIRFYRQWDCGRYGIEIDDLVQEGYFAMLDTLRKHDSEKGSFNTLFAFDLRRAFQDVIGRTDRKRGDLLNHCLSLDVPISDDDPDFTLLDTISDTRDDIEAVNQKLFVEQLHEALEQVLSTIPEKEAEVIKARYYEGSTQEAIAEKMSMTGSNVSLIEAKGLRHIRKPQNIRKLQHFVDFETNFYKGMSSKEYMRAGKRPVEELVINRDLRLKELENLTLTDFDFSYQKWKAYREEREEELNLMRKALSKGEEQ